MNNSHLARNPSVLAGLFHAALVTFAAVLLAPFLFLTLLPIVLLTLPLDVLAVPLLLSALRTSTQVRPAYAPAFLT